MLKQKLLSERTSAFRKIIRSSLLLLVCSIVSRFAGFAVNFFAARIFEQATFGQFMFLRRTCSMIEAISSGSIGNILLRETSKFFETNKSFNFNLIIGAFALNLLTGGIVALLSLLLYEQVIERFLGGGSQTGQITFLSCLLLVGALLSATSQRIFIGADKLKELFVAGALSTALGLPFVYLLTRTLELPGVLAGVTLLYLIDFLIKSFFMFRDKAASEAVFCFLSITRFMWLLVRDGCVLILSVIITSVSIWYLRVLAVQQSGDFTEVAIFEAAHQWFTLVMICTGASTSIAFQMLSRSLGGGTDSDLDILKSHVLLNLVITIMFAFSLYVLSREFMGLFGDDYSKGYYLLDWLAPVVVLATLASVMDKFLIVRGKNRLILISVSVAAALSVMFMCSGAVSDAGLKLAKATLIYYATLMVLLVYFVLRDISVRPDKRE